MWGTHSHTCRRIGWTRIIPTYVGNTATMACASFSSADHPHVCGEHCEKADLKIDPYGSSPRMWETRKERSVSYRLQRIIPTYVGNTRILWCEPDRDGGSSPRMWGTRKSEPSPSRQIRIIPTYVGNTQYMWRMMIVHADHPHVCGERGPEDFLAPEERGSSPRMWGTLCILLCKLNRGRIIPTYVGNTALCRLLPLRATDHPHVCGEHALRWAREKHPGGSSPRMWGTRAIEDFDSLVTRIIPTYVGNTVSDMPPTTGQADHPHVCGEH